MKQKTNVLSQPASCQIIKFYSLFVSVKDVFPENLSFMLWA